MEPASQSEQAVCLTNPLDKCGFSIFVYSSDVISLIFFFPFQSDELECSRSSCEFALFLINYSDLISLLTGFRVVHNYGGS